MAHKAQSLEKLNILKSRIVLGFCTYLTDVHLISAIVGALSSFNKNIMISLLHKMFY